MRYASWFTAAALLLAAPAALAATYRVDPAHSFPQFEIRHMSFSMIHGQFNHTTGTITMDRVKGLGAVSVTIAVDSIDTGYARRNKDLLAPSFFDAAKYPTMTYRSTKVVYQGKDAAIVYGDLTMKGTTKPVALHVTRIHCAKSPLHAGERCGFDATADIRRSDFGVSGDLPFIPDAVHLVINVDAVSRPSQQE